MLGPIVLACDEAYAMPLATALRSIVEANGASWPLDFFILAFAFPAATRERVAASLPSDSATIHWVTVDLTAFQDFSTPHHISKVTYARFLIPRVFPETVTTVLYLDADLIVLGDLRPLWETDLGGAVVGAVLDGLDTQIKANEPISQRAPRVQNYFNAGVLLIDLLKWREEKVSEAALDYLTLHPDTPFSDQDALNVACDGKWKQLDGRWNFVDYFERVEMSALDHNQLPWIVHFATWEKPWNAKIRHINAGFYDAFRSRTRFARTPFERRRDAWRGKWSGLGVAEKLRSVRALWEQRT